MTNLEKIKAAWAMGWSATLKDATDEHQVLSIKGNFVYINGIDGRLGGLWKGEELEDYETYKVKITGYKYAGGLAGSEPIPERQEFRAKKEDIILRFKLNSGDRCEFFNTMSLYDKSEIEPVFK